jgi:glycerate 2-kinase
MDPKELAEKIFLAGIESVLPANLIARQMMIRDNYLVAGSLKFSIEESGKIYVIGAGKASGLMAAEVEKLLGDRITDGHIAVKYGHACQLKYIKITEAGHPVPDSNGYKATREILEIAGKATHNDLVICLISGGGSALLADFPEGSSPEEMALLSQLLINSGASISEINTIRKHLSLVKGGQLSKAIYPGTVVSLILSDIIGDPIDAIASGPTSPDPTTFNQAIGILRKYNLVSLVPAGILKYLEEGKKGNRNETPKSGDPVFKKTYNILTGSNRSALEAGRRKAKGLEINSFIIDDRLQGDVTEVAKRIVEVSLKYQYDNGVRKPACLLFGGEPTLKVTGNGTGGRNQHLALMCSLLLQDKPGITLLIAGTDGSDGPTDATGAVVDSDTARDALSKGFNPEKYLGEFDSYNFFKNAGGHIKTGPTGTNVMDMMVAIIKKPGRRCRIN